MPLKKYNLDTIGSEFLHGCILTLGNFDGVHIGHQTLLKRVKNRSLELSTPSCVVTYSPNPSLVLGKKQDFRYLTSDEAKESAISKFGIDFLLTLEFTQALSQMSAEDFLKEIIIGKLHTKHIVLGYNHSFGKDRKGDFELLKAKAKQYSYEVELYETTNYQGERVSSSLVRSYIERGEVFRASQLLARSYSQSAIVFQGDERGRLLGFPTANLRIEDKFLIPGPGVYSGFITVRGVRYKCMTNIGTNPTFGGNLLSIETHIIDFSSNIYGLEVEIEFVHRIRDEKKFDSADDLIAQLNKDKISSIHFLQRVE